MNVIFLDIDGVLNCIRDFQMFGEDYISPLLVGRLDQIVKNTAAKIVLSSSWRMDPKSRHRVTDALRPFDLEIFSCTPVIDMNQRHKEIESWLHSNVVNRFAILDDDSRASLPAFKTSFFQTDPDIGLTQAMVRKAIEHLNV